MAESAGILLLDAEDNSEAGLTVTEEGSNIFSIATGAKAHGTYGYNFAFSGNDGENDCNFYKSFTAGADIYMRFYLYIPSAFDCNQGAQLTFGGLHYAKTAVAAKPYFLRDASGNINLYRFYYYTNTGITNAAITPTTITRDTWHYMEMRFKSGAGDGVVTLWMDGSEIVSVTDLTNNNYQAGYASAGNITGAIPTASSEFYIDDIKIDSLSIGAYADEATGSIVPIILAMDHFNGGM